MIDRTAPAAAPRPRTRRNELPPLQLRTPQQLQDGMTIKLKGAGSNDLFVARLVQDSAEYVAKTAGTTMGLKDVTLNDKGADDAGALGWATFNGTRGWFGVSQRSTKDLLSGVEYLRSNPSRSPQQAWDAWTETGRAKFLQGNATLLHEAGHITLPDYEPKTISNWKWNADRSFEEGLTEITTMGQVYDFMRHEYGIEIAPTSQRIQNSISAYTKFTERIERALSMGTPSGTAHQTFQAARAIADNTDPTQREREIARRIATNLGGEKVPQKVIDEITKTLPGFVAEKNGTRTRLMEIQAALVDFRETGNRRALSARLKALDPIDPALIGRQPIGDAPLARK